MRGNYKYNRNLLILLTGIIYLLSAFFLNSRLFAIEVRKIVVLGNTVDVGVNNIIKGIRGDLSKEEIEAIGVRITGAYHKRGFSTSNVQRLVIKENGVLEIHVKESRILGLKVTGISDKEAGEIGRLILPIEEEIYNRFVLEKRAREIKRRYNLDSVSVNPVNFEDSGDVFLSVKVERTSRGNLYGGISVEPIYGISPEIGFFYPFDVSAIDLFAAIGYRDRSLRKAEADIKYFIFNEESSAGIYLGVNGSRLLEEWRLIDSEYKCLSLTPIFGIRYMREFITLDIYVREIITRLNDYRIDYFIENRYDNYDTRCTLDLDISNKDFKVDSRDSSDVKLSLSAGISDLAEDGYLISSGEIKSAFSPIIYLRFIPRVNIYYTTSPERFYWSYVYDKNMLGFFDNYTASKWKNIFGLDAEIEISPQFIYAGPFVNTGRFLSELEKWKTKTGGGVKCGIIYKKFSIDVYYAWDFSKSAAEGGLYILLGGRF